jgi:hypothetical protein
MTNKVLVFAHIVGHGQINANHAIFRIVRDTTTIYAGDTAGNRASGFHSGMATDTNSAQSGTGVFLDSPSTTSATTYKIQGVTNAGTFYVNRSPDDSDHIARVRAASSITAMEISA